MMYSLVNKKVLVVKETCMCYWSIILKRVKLIQRYSVAHRYVGDLIMYSLPFLSKLIHQLHFINVTVIVTYT